MNNGFMRCRVVLLYSLFSLCEALCYARIRESWPYELLVAQSDVVALVEPLENHPANDSMSNEAVSRRWYTAVDTRCKMRGILKGAIVGELTILHFSYAPGASVDDGPIFVEFTIRPARPDFFEHSVIKDGVKFTVPRSPVWLVFLKRRSDGRYEPVAGQDDADISFRCVDTDRLREIRKNG